MPEKPDSEPKASDVEAVRTGAIHKITEDLERELGHLLDFTIDVVVNDRVFQTLPPQPRPGAQVGTVRLRFRNTGDPARRLFFIDAVFPQDERTPTFSGFVCRGHVRREGGRSVAAFETWTLTREDWNWHRWL
jgi:hypothetical protein